MKWTTSKKKPYTCFKKMYWETALNDADKAAGQTVERADGFSSWNRTQMMMMMMMMVGMRSSLSELLLFLLLFSSSESGLGSVVTKEYKYHGFPHRWQDAQSICR